MARRAPDRFRPPSKTEPPCGWTPACSQTWRGLSGKCRSCSGSRASPALDLAAGPVHGVVCKNPPRRRLQEPSFEGPRRHAALGLLVCRIAPASRSLKPPGPLASPDRPEGQPKPAPGPSRSLPRSRETSTAFAAPAPTGTGFRSRPPDARVAIGRSVQRFLTRVAFPGLVPHRFRSHPAGAACEAPPLQSDACFTFCQRA
jgi:hypothetical protein